MRRQQKQKQYYDRNSKDLKELKQGDKIIVQNVKTKLWEPAIILCKTENPRSYKIKTNNGRILIRNRKFLKLSKNSNQQIDYNFDDLPDNNPPPNNVPKPISNNQTNVNGQCNTTSSRTGRIIRRPQYLNDYDCN